MIAPPKHWVVAPLRDVVSKLVDGSHNPPPKMQHGLPMLSAINIANNRIELSSYRLIDAVAFADEDRRTRVSPGDVLLTIVGAIGRAAVVPQNPAPFTLQRSVAVISPVLFEPRFLMYQLEAPRLARYLSDNARGTAQKGVYLNTLGQMPIWLAPLNEQRRIVAKIDELFSELDGGVGSLDIARQQLKAYRHSVLMHAFQGKLTEDWRARNPSHLQASRSIASRLQELIGEQTRRVASATSSGARPIEGLENIPAGWVIFPLGQLFDVVSGGTPKGVEDVNGGDVPFYKISDMNNPGNERFMRESKLSMTEAEARSLGLTIRPLGTIIFPKRGGAILTNKKRILSRRATFDLNTMGIVNRRSEILNEYLWRWVDGLDLATIYDGSNVPQINNKNVEPLPFPICSLEEQAEVVRILENKLEAADLMMDELEAALARAVALRHSILKWAFSGQLVAQDPTDEPAYELLDRIRASAENPNTAKRRNNKNNKKEAA